MKSIEKMYTRDFEEIRLTQCVICNVFIKVIFELYTETTKIKRKERNRKKHRNLSLISNVYDIYTTFTLIKF